MIFINMVSFHLNKKILQVEHLVYGLDSVLFLLHTSHLPLVLLNCNQWAPKFPNLTSEIVELFVPSWL